MNNFTRAALCAGVLSLTFSMFSCQENQENEFELKARPYFNSIIDSLGIPGFAVVVVQGEKTLLADGFGFADLEAGNRSDDKTAYYIASSTKSYTGLLAEILDRQDIVKLDEYLVDYFPEIRNDTIPAFDSVRIRDLLTHTSGIDNAPISWRVAFTGDHDQELLLELMKYCKPNESGFGNYQYTNVGYNIYALLLERETGKSWKDWMDESIFEPTGMRRTSAYISEAEEKGWTLARPYITLDGIQRIELEKTDKTMQSAGGLITTAEDMAAWLKIQLAGGALHGKQVFSKDVMESAHYPWVDCPESKRTFKPEHYGMGWEIGQYEGRKTLNHFGGFAGFATHVSFIPGEQIGVAVMINDAFTGGRLMNFIALGIYDYLLAGDEEADFDLAELETFSSRVNGAREGIGQQIAERKLRTWALSLDFDDYAGTYVSDKYGSLVISSPGDGLSLQFGNLSSVAEAYPQADAIRVELIPLTGEVIQMDVEQGQVNGLKYDGVYFEKVK